MSLKSFNQNISSVFAVADQQAKIIKSSLIALCSDIDRTFRLSFSASIYEGLTQNEFDRAKRIFPNFEKLSLEQVNRLIVTLTELRDVSAHLYLNRRITLDEDLEDFISELIESRYSIANDREITLFGAICCTFLFSNNIQICTFITEAIRHNVVAEVDKGTMAVFQRDFQNSIKKLIGTGKQIGANSQTFLCKRDVVFVIEIAKKTVTRLIFALEERAKKDNKTVVNAKSLNKLLDNYVAIVDNPELRQRIVDLRNYWLHGYLLFDTIHAKNGNFVFDIEYLFGTLAMMKNAFSEPVIRPILFEIDECASKLIDFFSLRLVELSFKVLDKNLFDKEKMNARIEKTVFAYDRLKEPGQWFFSKRL